MGNIVTVYCYKHSYENRNRRVEYRTGGVRPIDAVRTSTQGAMGTGENRMGLYIETFKIA